MKATLCCRWLSPWCVCRSSLPPFGRQTRDSRPGGVRHQDTIVALRVTSSGKLRVANVNSGKYPTVTFSADPAQAVDREHHSWANYFLCGYKGVFDHLSAGGAKGGPVPACAGLDVMVDGRVPTGSGLSSSSALVCASALAVMTALGASTHHALRDTPPPERALTTHMRPLLPTHHITSGLDFPQQDVAELACVCERYCGTQSGGMDQAISIMGQRGLAKVVHFNPVRTEDVHLPAGAAFVIANSLTVSNKAETAHTRYNLRVVECRLAAAALALALGASPEQARKTRTLKEVEPLAGGRAVRTVPVCHDASPHVVSPSVCPEASAVPLSPGPGCR